MVGRPRSAHFPIEGASAAGCGLSTSGRNSNRSTVTVNNLLRDTFCTNGRDQTVTHTSTNGGSMTLGYDSFGRMNNGHGKTFGYDGLDRHTSTTSPTGTVTFTYDKYDRRVTRTSTVPGDVSTTLGYVGAGDSPVFTLTGAPGSFTINDYAVSLPGGVSMMRQQQPTLNIRWAYGNGQGSLAAVTTDTGAKIGNTYRWDPDGMPLPSPGSPLAAVQPDLNTGKFEPGWLGTHHRYTDTNDPANPIVEMGARVYLPRLAKFTAPDPVERGVGDADYLYPANPINHMDLSGLDMHDRAKWDRKYSQKNVSGWDGKSSTVRIYVADPILQPFVQAALNALADSGINFVYVSTAAEANLTWASGDALDQKGTRRPSVLDPNSNTILLDVEFLAGRSGYSQNSMMSVATHGLGHYFGFADGQAQIMSDKILKYGTFVDPGYTSSIAGLLGLG
jgi:RHS repeat-associated protein